MNSQCESKNDMTRILGLSQSGNSGKRKKCWIAGSGAVVLAALIWMLLGVKGQSNRVQYETQPVRRGDLTLTVSATGTLQPMKNVDVGCEVSGIIKTVEVDCNDEVKIGQVLVRLDTSKLQDKVLQSEAALEVARAKLLQTRATVQEAKAQLARLNHVRELSQGKIPSQVDLDTQIAAVARSKADEAGAKASVTQANALLNADRTDLSKAVIHSPINGVVLTRTVEPGQTVAASFQSPVLFTLAEDLTQLELQVDVDQADVGNVQEMQDATFTVDAFPDQHFPAHITQVRWGSETVNGVVTYKAELQVDNSQRNLRPGMTATAVIVVNKITDALLVPNSALRFSPRQSPEETPSGGGSILQSILPHPPSGNSKTSDNTDDANRSSRVWLLQSGGLTAIPIVRGLTDGQWTEVTGADLETGSELVVGEVATGS